MHVFGCDPESEAAASLLPLQPGAKAENLIRLSESGFCVPPFFVLPASAFQFVLHRSPMVCELLEAVEASEGENRERCGRDLREAVASCEWPTALVEDFGDAVARLNAGFDSSAPGLLAIRSSIAGQTTENGLLPGRHESFLFVEGIEDAIQNTKRVWASAFNEQVLNERNQQSLDLSGIAMAVIIQHMVDPLISGVCYTSNPKTGSPREMVVSTLWGAGNSSDSQDIACDTFTFDKQTRGYHPDIAEKKWQLRREADSNREYCEVEVESGDRRKATLNEDELNVVALTALEIEGSYHRPQGVEFCFDKQRRLVVLQSQTLSQDKQVGPASGNRIEWGLTKSLQGCVGVTSPMTFSMYQKAFLSGSHSLGQIAGVKELAILRQRHLIKNMLGLIRGRIFLNLEDCQQLCQNFAGAKFPSSVMLSIFGLEAFTKQGAQSEPAKQKTTGLSRILGRLRFALGTGWKYFRCRSKVARSQQGWEAFFEEAEGWDFTAATPRELMHYLEKMEEVMGAHGRALITNQLVTATYLSGLKWMGEYWVTGDTRESDAELDGEMTLDSPDELASLWEQMASLVKGNPELRQAVGHGDASGMAERVGQREAFGEFHLLVNQFLQRWGHWGVAGYKLEQPSFGDDPDWIYRILQRELQEEGRFQHQIAETVAVQRRTIRKFEEQVLPRLGFSLLPRKWIFKHSINAVAAGQQVQADGVNAKMRVCDLLRKTLQCLGAQWASDGIIGNSEDVFYLTLDEVGDFIMGRAMSADPCRIATSRRVEFFQFNATPPPPERFETWGCVYQGNDFSDGDD